MTLTELTKESKETKKEVVSVFGRTLLGATITAIGLYQFVKGVFYVGGIFGVLNIYDLLDETWSNRKCEEASETRR